MIALLTGVTGLVGSHVAIAMLNRGHRVVALSRNRHGAAAEKRVVRLLEAYPGWRASDRPLADILVLDGDLLKPSCGVKPQDLATLRGNVDVLLHCAGEVLFLPAAKMQDTLRVNTEGVKNMLALARELRCPRMVHVSTAYVDGGHHETGFRTDYERTKAEGENILKNLAAPGFNAVILRPSIITGDQVHGFSPTFNGIYPFLRFVAENWAILRHVPPDRWLPDRFYRDQALNLVPGEVVAEAVRGLAEDPSGRRRVLTLINPVDWPVRDLVQIVAAYFQANPHGCDMNPMAEGMNVATVKRNAQTLLGIYAPYVGTRLRVAADSGNALEAIKGMPVFNNRPEWIHALLDWCVKQCWQEVT